MTALFTVAGISIISEIVARLMEEYGQGNKIVFVKIAAYIACGYVAFDFWWDGVRYVASQFGVHI
jgi:hypothetical protein